MKNKWVILVFALSLAFNFAFLGALGYKLWVKKPKTRIEAHSRNWKEGTSPEERIHLRKDQKERLEKLRKEFFPRLKGIRVEMQQERKNLGILLIQEKPDTAVIVKRLDRIGKLQTRIEKEVVFHVLKETESMDPQQREIYIQIIMKRMRERRPEGGENPRWNQPQTKELRIHIQKEEKQP